MGNELKSMGAKQKKTEIKSKRGIKKSRVRVRVDAGGISKVIANVLVT